MADMKLNPRERAALEELEKSRKTRRKFIVVGIIVLILAALVVVVNSRIFTQKLPALKVSGADSTTNYSLADVNYQYQSSYMQMYQQYGSYGLIDTNTPLDQQDCVFGEGTWDDYFKETAKENLVQVTAYYDAATAAGYTELTEDEQAQIDEAMEYYTLYASYAGAANLNNYLGRYFGNGNNEDTVRENMRRELLVSRYLSDLSNSYSYTDAEKDAYYDENADTLDQVRYLYVNVPAAADEAAGITQEAALAAANEAAAAIAEAAADEDSFRAAAEEAGYDVQENSYVVSSFLSVYADEVSGREDLVNGKAFAHEMTNSVYAVYVLGIEDNHYNTVSVRHILIKCEDTDGDGVYSDAEKQTALDAVKAIEAEWKAGAADEDSFAALATEKTEDTGSAETGGLYENIYKGQMVPEFDAFCFGDHQHGDTAIVYGESSSYAGYHLVYFVSADGELYSRVLADQQLRSADYNARLEEIAEPYSAEETFMWRYVMKEVKSK